ncbi:SPOSA6832_01522 [Sporobolomyces salmonicolor]|uniref:SPOSA6832_01522-mRNA-1:cds n=1 Tax=Sporidiobolus salmonicolor TaxID=5005 RepID=A0A0D6EIZ2_SPOSA|nr:SPOSA6832_01522 [Sporobolomyces salmonicolor]
MNVGHDSTDSAELTKAFSAAASVPNFYLFFSFDMNYFSTSGSGDSILNDYLVPFANSSAYYLHEGQVFVPNWNDVSLVPQDNWGGGVLSWAAWGDKGRTTDMTTDSDVAYRAAATKAGLSYVAPVGAILFVQVAASNRDEVPDFIEISTCNDCGEAHYLGNLHDRTPILMLSVYYNWWFKAGSAPTITSELVVWYYRLHPAGATASSDSLAQPAYATTLGDTIFAVALIPTGSKASTLVITTPASFVRLEHIPLPVLTDNPRTSTAGGYATAAQDVSEGINLISVNFAAGSTGIAHSSGNEILSGTGADINASPATYDFNFVCYILSADAAPSSTGSTSSGSISSATTGSAATTDSGPSEGQTKTSVIGSASPSSTSSRTPTSSVSGSDSTGATGPSSSTDDDSSRSSSSLTAPGWLGLQAWEWLCILGVALVLLGGLVSAERRRSWPDKAATWRKDDSTSSTEGSNTDDEGTSTD